VKRDRGIRQITRPHNVFQTGKIAAYLIEMGSGGMRILEKTKNLDK
jgi:hypothetical protein